MDLGGKIAFSFYIIIQLGRHFSCKETRDSKKNETWQNDGYFSNFSNLPHNKSERSKLEQSTTVIILTMAAMAELAMHI